MIEEKGGSIRFSDTSAFPMIEKRDGLAELLKLVDDALLLARELRQQTTVQILSMASLEISQQIERLSAEGSPD